MKNFLINVKTFGVMFKQLMTIMERKHRFQSIIILVGAFVCATLETLGVSSILPFILILLSPDEMMNNQYVKILADFLRITDYYSLLFATAGLIALVYLVKNLMIIFFQYLQGKLHNEIERDLNVKMFRMFMLRPYSFYLQMNTADVIRGINSDVSSVAQVIDKYSGLISEGVTCLMIGIFIILIDPIIAFGIMGTAAVLAIFFILVFKKKTGQIGRICREFFTRKSKIVMQSVAGYKEISITQKKDFFVDEYYDVASAASKKNTEYLLIQKIPSRAIETVFITSLLALVCLRVGYSTDSTEFVALIGTMAVAAVRILPSISSISGYMNGLVYNRVALEAAYNNIVQVRKEEEYYKDAKIKHEKGNKISFNNSVTINDVHFHYEKSDVEVLDGISLEIKKNSSVAFVGESGAGKSTLLDVLLGLLTPQSGNIMLDEHDIKEIPYDWAEIVGYVPQSVFLLDDTVRRNIAFGVPDDEINDDKIWETLKEAQLDDFVKNLPKGLDTTVGERGVRFSGGQRQRIAIARALYHDPEILVLDEATSALDTATEKEVMKAIDNFHGKMTIVIVAHRLSTIENCDIAYSVGNGKVVPNIRK